MGPCLLPSNLRPFHDELVERVRDSILLSSFILNLRRSSKMWIEPFACLVFIALLIPFLRFPLFAMASGSKEAKSRVPLFWFGRA